MKLAVVGLLWMLDIDMFLNPNTVEMYSQATTKVVLIVFGNKNRSKSDRRGVEGGRCTTHNSFLRANLVTIDDWGVCFAPVSITSSLPTHGWVQQSYIQ